MTDTATPVAAWYPDPADQSRQRWWDGAQWSAHVREAEVVTAPPAPAVTSNVPALSPEDKLAYYRAQTSAQTHAPVASAPVGPALFGAPAPGGISAPAFGSLASIGYSPDPARSPHLDKEFRQWKDNKASTSALVFAGINLAVLAFAFFQHLSPYYRVVPSIIGIVFSTLALRQALSTGAGLVKSIVALAINIVIGLIAGIALLQMLSNTAADIGEPFGGVSDVVDYSNLVESSVRDRSLDAGYTFTSVDCPDDMLRTAGVVYSCVGTLDSGATVSVSVEVRDSSGSFDFTISG